MHADARFIARAAGSANASLKVLKFFGQWTGLAQLFGNAQVASVQDGIEPANQYLFGNVPAVKTGCARFFGAGGYGDALRPHPSLYEDVAHGAADAGFVDNEDR